MHWVGKEVDRVGRGGSGVPACETRWIVPARPYQAPKGSMEKVENMILMGVGIAAILFSFAMLIASAM